MGKRPLVPQNSTCPPIKYVSIKIIIKIIINFGDNSLLFNVFFFILIYREFTRQGGFKTYGAGGAALPPERTQKRT